MYNIEPQFVQQLKDDGEDLWTISQYEHWLSIVPKLAPAIQQIRDAFHGVQLGDGVGLLEADGRDAYASDAELARLRQLDERIHWENLSPEELRNHSSSPTFFDAKGFHFHLPAFLIAELIDKIEFDFISYVVEYQPATGSWADLLTPRQADSLATVLSILTHFPSYCDSSSRKYVYALQRFTAIASAPDDNYSDSFPR